MGLAHPQPSPLRQLPSSHERLRALKMLLLQRKEGEHTLTHKFQGSRARRLGLAFRIVLPKIHFSQASPKCARLWFPGKGTRNMTPQVTGLFYATKLQTSTDWWKSPQHFAFKKVLRWVDHGVKVEFKKNLTFVPNGTFGAEICRPSGRRLCDQRSFMSPFIQSFAEQTSSH